MLQHPVELPLEIWEFACRQQYMVPKTARCETFFARWTAAASPGPPRQLPSLRCLASTQALVRGGKRYAIAAIYAGTAEERNSLKQHFLDLLRVSGLALPDSRSAHEAGFIFLQAPWAYRGEMRMMLARAADTWRPRNDDEKDEGQADEAQERVGDVPSVFVSLPSADTTQVDIERFRDQLLEFGLAYDGPLQSVLRRVLSSEDTRTWRFPLGCTVIETRSRASVSWTLEFEEIEHMERAHVLLTPVLLEMRRMGSRLRPEHTSIAGLGDDVVTEIPALCIASDGNSRAARVEMMRLVRNLVLSLDRMGMHEEVEVLEPDVDEDHVRGMPSDKASLAG